jgi:hypothetical protein
MPKKECGDAAIFCSPGTSNVWLRRLKAVATALQNVTLESFCRAGMKASGTWKKEKTSALKG